jgi:hypothetical protein
MVKNDESQIVDAEVSQEVSTRKETKKVYCANCINCKLVRIPVGNGRQYQLRVRCAGGQWTKKNGDEKFHKYFTLGRRTVDSCESYQPMGDTKTFMKELKATLPTRDEIYGELED